MLFSDGNQRMKLPRCITTGISLNIRGVVTCIRNNMKSTLDLKKGKLISRNMRKALTRLRAVVPRSRRYILPYRNRNFSKKILIEFKMNA